MTADEAVQTWGYSGISGPSARALAGLRHYGLVEGTNNALRLSGDAIAILVSDQPREHLEALQRAARRPRVFQEILSVFPPTSDQPSDGAIKAYLLKDTQFGQSATSEIIEAFRETTALAKLYENPDNTEDDGREKPPIGASGGTPPAVGFARREGAMAGREQATASLSWPGMNFAYTAAGSTHTTLTIVGNPPDEESAAQIGRYLDLVKSEILAEAKKATSAKKKKPEDQ